MERRPVEWVRFVGARGLSAYVDGELWRREGSATLSCRVLRGVLPVVAPLPGAVPGG